MGLFNTADTIESEDVMTTFDCSKSSASHHFLTLVEEGKIICHGIPCPTSFYTLV